MSQRDIEILDDGDAHPYSSHIRVDETEIQLGDLLLVFESGESRSVNFSERIYGFTWPGITIHVVDGPVSAEFHEFNSLSQTIGYQLRARGAPVLPDKIALGRRSSR